MPYGLLADERDGLHARAKRDLRRTAGRRLFVTAPVLTEVCVFLAERWLRSRLRYVLDGLAVADFRLEEPWRDDVFAWLEKYAEHEPDFADGELAIAASRSREVRVWTYDREFRTTWRRADGTRIPMLTS